MLPIHCLHRKKSIWGEDANEFNPDRWDAPSDAIKNVPSVWSHLFSFLAGSHACIGFRFSIAEYVSSSPCSVRTTSLHGDTG